MKRKLLFLILASLLFFTTGFAQTQANSTKQNRFEFSTGYNFGALQNLEIAPVNRYDYNGLIYKFSYERRSKNENLFNIQLDYLSSNLQTDVIPVLNLDYAKVGLRFSYLKQIFAKKKFSVHLGLQSYSNASIYSKSDIHNTILNQSFGIASQLSHKINEKQSLSSRLAIPLVLLRNTQASSGIYSLKKYQSVSWNIGYNYSLSPGFDAIFSYDFNYDRLQITSSFREIQHQVNLGLNYKF